ncbi:MAG: primosomal protein N' [Cyanobacteria bacterium Co-bin13]|nr:primosomal protein N' [Cyanobacteria bacterium Co-bin13]
MQRQSLPSVLPKNPLDWEGLREGGTVADGGNIYITPEPKWVEVLVDCPGAQGLYTYGVPPELEVQPGDILSVPFGHQQVGAIALRLATQLPETVAAQQIRPVEGILNRRFFSPTYWQLLEQVASYYQTSLMQVIRTALPPGLLARSQRRVRLCPNPVPLAAAALQPAAATLLAHLHKAPNGNYTWQHLQKLSNGNRRALQQLIEQGWVESYLAPPQPPRPKQRQAVTLLNLDNTALSPRQQEILAILKRQGGDLWLNEALQICQTTSATLKRLAASGHLLIEAREVLRRPTDTPDLQPDQAKPLTPAQQQALAAISQQTHHCQMLLHGVTGSGKTEVYLQAIAPHLAAGQSALVLVPEIGLTPQLTDRFRRRFGSQVCVYHSALSDGERYDTWRQMLSGQPQVVIGTRSAIFAPLPRLGILILDEEHDSSFKQDSPAPCYHARTVAQWRAQLEDCPLVLGSATPSLETWLACFFPSQGASPCAPISPPSSLIPPLSSPPSTRYLSLPQRVHARPHPPVKVVDMREELQVGNRSIFSHPLQAALRQMKAEGNQGLLFIHRRGHSSFVSCRSCGHVMMCPHCDVSLSYHQPNRDSATTLQCHYCGYVRSHPRNCPECASPYLKHFGSGTQRVVNALAETFPDLTCIRFDSDTTRTKGSHRALLTRFAQGGADLLVGTQMLTKGIDLPQVTLVGIVAADGLLYMNDYWASERAFQTLTQVAGRAGRGDQPGQVILQTYTPEHPVVEAVQQQAYDTFIEAEWAQRQALAYPPAGRLALVRLSSPDPEAVQQAAKAAAAHLQTLIADCKGYELLGPVPAPVLRVARRYRWQLLLKCQPNQPLPDLTSLRKQAPAHVSLTVDIDPLNLS